MVGKNLNKKMDIEKKGTHIKNMQILSKVFVFFDKKTEREKKKETNKERREVHFRNIISKY
jgi:hypothetical protein